MYVVICFKVPEMNEVAEEASKVSLKKAFHTLLLQNIGMGIGVLALYILARYQDSINFGWRIELCQDSSSQNIFLKLVY